jgi:hypothetical protein
MTDKPKRSGGELFIEDNSDDDWQVHRYLHDWCEIARAFDIAIGYFEIGSLLSLDGQWQKLDAIRILSGHHGGRQSPCRGGCYPPWIRGRTAVRPYSGRLFSE